MSSMKKIKNWLLDSSYGVPLTVLILLLAIWFTFIYCITRKPISQSWVNSQAARIYKQLPEYRKEIDGMAKDGFTWSEIDRLDELEYIAQTRGTK